MKHLGLLAFVLSCCCACNPPPSVPGSPPAAGASGSEATEPGGASAPGSETEPPGGDPAPPGELLQYEREFIEAHVAKLRSADGEVRAMGIASSPVDPRHFARHPELLDQIRGALVEVATGDSLDENRAQALGKIAGMGEAAGPAVPQLLRLLEHPTDCSHLSGNLSRMGTAGQAAIPRMIELLATSSKANRRHLVEGLGHFGGRAGAAAVSALTAIVIDDPDTFLRVKAAHALGAIGVPDAAAIEALDQAARTGTGALQHASRTAAETLRKAR